MSKDDWWDDIPPMARIHIRSAEARISELEAELGHLRSVGLSMVAAYPSILDKTAVTEVARVLQKQHMEQEAAFLRALEREREEAWAEVERLRDLHRQIALLATRALKPRAALTETKEENR